MIRDHLNKHLEFGTNTHYRSWCPPCPQDPAHVGKYALSCLRVQRFDESVGLPEADIKLTTIQAV